MKWWLRGIAICLIVSLALYARHLEVRLLEEATKAEIDLARANFYMELYYNREPAEISLEAYDPITNLVREWRIKGSTGFKNYREYFVEDDKIELGSNGGQRNERYR